MALEDFPYSFNPLLAVDRATQEVARGAVVTLRAEPDGPALQIADLDGTPRGTTLTTTDDGVVPAHRTTVVQPYLDAGAGVMLRESAVELANALLEAQEARAQAERAAQAAEAALAALQDYLPGEGEGEVLSVNDRTGHVVLNAVDIPGAATTEHLENYARYVVLGTNDPVPDDTPEGTLIFRADED